MGNCSQQGARAPHWIKELTFDGSGVLKLQKSSHVEPCNTGSEILVKYALTRRALALEQANLAKFSLMEAWSEKMMQSRLEEPNSGFSRTTMKQLEQADRKLFVLLGEQTREGIKATAGGRPIDAIFKREGQERIWKCENSPGVARVGGS